MPRTSELCSGSSLTIVALLAGALAASSCSRSMSTPVAPTAHAAAALSGSGTDADASEVVVTLAPGTDAGALAASLGATLVEAGDGGRTAALLPPPGTTAATLEQRLSSELSVLTSDPNGWLETAESRQQSFAFDDGFGSAQTVAEQPAARAIHLAEAHSVALGEGVTVAILDTGIDPEHPLLRSAFAGGMDFVDGDADPTETRNGVDDDGDGQVDEAFGHGTHVAGIIHLVAPAARLLAVRVLGDDGRGSLLDVVEGVHWAVEHGARVINLSLGSLQSSDALQAALEEAEERGIAVIVAAGNWGDDKPEEFPARSSHVAAIAAVDATAHAAAFSSFGDIVALAAPGVGVRSTYPGGGFRLWSGTSMSAPFVAGTCALLAGLHPDWRLSDMLARIAATARQIRDGGNEFGAGALDTGAALEPDRRSHVDDEPVPETLRPH